MIFPVGKLIEHQDELVSVHKDETVRDALVRMMSNDFSQLPVIDEQGNLSGIISEQSITRAYFYANDSVPLSDLPVHHCQASPVTISPDADLFDALGRLRDVAALVVVQNRRPIGVVTYYDVTHFFRNVSEGLMYVEDIEVTLRQYIESVYTDESKLTAALIRVFGQSKQYPGQPYRQYEQLSFYQHMQFITNEANWSHFEPYLQPRGLFHQYMDQVREIRNQLAHFRDELSPIQIHALLHVRDWLAARSKPVTSTPIASENVPDTIESSPTTDNAHGKYAALHAWLLEQPATKERLQLTFEQLERLLGESLPDSAKTHRAWWADDAAGHVQTRAWLRAGWKVEDVDFSANQVVFKYDRAVMQKIFFIDLISRIKAKRPALQRPSNTYPSKYCSFYSSKNRLYFTWEFLQGNHFKTALYIDTVDAETNLRIYETLKEKRAEIEEAARIQLEWDGVLGERSTRIAASRTVDVALPDEELEAAKEWAVNTMLKLIQVFEPYIQEFKVE